MFLKKGKFFIFLIKIGIILDRLNISIHFVLNVTNLSKFWIFLKSFGDFQEN